MRHLLCIPMLFLLANPVALAESDFIPDQPLRDAGLAKFWQLQLPLDPGQELRDAHLVDDQLYLGTQDGFVFALHASTGVLRWLRPVTRPAYHIRRPCHAGENTYFVTPTDIVVYDRRSGKPLDRRALRFPSGSSPLCDGERLFIGGLDRRLYAFDIDTLYVAWKVVTNGPIASRPALRGDHVFAANNGGSIYACTRDKKVLHWKGQTFDSVTADLVVHEKHGVYVASRDLSLYLLDFDFGRIRWRARFSGPLYEAPIVTDELAYQYCPDDGLVAVETAVIGAEERLRWKLPRGRTALTVHDGLAYILTKDATIVAVDTKTGEVMSTLSAPGFTIAIPAPMSSTILVAAEDGRVFCARPVGAPPLLETDVLAALRPPAETPAETPVVEAETEKAASGPEDILSTKRRGIPIGGKSKVTRSFKGEEESE